MIAGTARPNQETRTQPLDAEHLVTCGLPEISSDFNPPFRRFGRLAGLRAVPAGLVAACSPAGAPWLAWCRVYQRMSEHAT
jgi:hypothetical protein